MTFFNLPTWFNSRILSSANNETARLKTEDGQTCFDEGRQFRISYPLSVSSTVRLKFSAPVDFVLRVQSLECDSGFILFEAFRASQITESTPFSTPVPVYRNNFMSTAPSYTRTINIYNGGQITVNGGELAVETMRVKTSGATAQTVTVESGVKGMRGLAAGDYYLRFTSLDATSTGVYVLIFEERP